MKNNAKLASINPDAAGIDIGGSFHFVAVPADRDEKPIRKFTNFTSDLNQLADWLTACKIKTVAMESVLGTAIKLRKTLSFPRMRESIVRQAWRKTRW